MIKYLVAFAAVSLACDAATTYVHTHKLARDELMKPAAGETRHAEYRLCGYDEFEAETVLVTPSENACPASVVLERAK